MPYTPKNYHLFKVVENRMQQCRAAHIVHSWQQYCSALLSLNQPESQHSLYFRHNQQGRHSFIKNLNVLVKYLPCIGISIDHHISDDV